MDFCDAIANLFVSLLKCGQMSSASAAIVLSALKQNTLRKTLPAHIAAGIGAYGTAVALYRRWIARGHEVTFVRDTNLVLQTTPRNAAVLKAGPH